MKPSSSTTVPHGIALLIITVTCHTACASLLEVKSFRLDNEEQNLSVRPSELCTIEPCSRWRSNVNEQYQIQPGPLLIVRDSEASAWQQQTVKEIFARYGSQSLLVVETPFKRHASFYRLACLSMIYDKTLLQANYICSTSEISP